MKKNCMLFLILLVGLLNAQWTPYPSQNNVISDLNGEQAIPKVVTGPTGDTFIGFFSNDAGNYDVRLQRLDSQGNELWDHNGILISDHTSMTWLMDWDMTVDQENNAILVFQDIRNAGNNNVYAYRISPDGTFVWGADGLELSNSPAISSSPKVCVTSAGNIIVAWQEETVSIIQKISPDGDILWGNSGITLSADDNVTWPQPFPVEDDEILLKYFEDSGPSWAVTRHMLMQKFDSNGNPVWSSPTVITNVPGISSWTQIFPIISDENNGCFIAWHDSRNGGTQNKVFAQHIFADGTVEFVDNGQPLVENSQAQCSFPEIVYDPATDELTAYWFQTDLDQNNYGISGQKLDGDGNRLWGNIGMAILPISELYVLPFAVRQANDNVIILYEESQDGFTSQIKALRLDSDGNVVWPNNSVTMSSFLSNKIHCEASDFSQGQIIAAWEDDRYGAADIYAQNINFDGTIGSVLYNGSIEGYVALNGGIGSIEDVEISAGGNNVYPDNSGYFSLFLPAGTYEVMANLQYYTSASVPDVVVVAGNTTTLSDTIILDWIPVFNPPQNGNVNSFLGFVSWDEPEPYPGAELIGYYIYLDGTLLEMVTATSYQLTNLINGMQYIVAITAVYDGDNESDPITLDFLYTGTGAGNDLNVSTKLIGNYPNPFNPETMISFNLSEAGHVTIEVYNIKGEKIKTLVDGEYTPTEHSIVWNGKDDNNKSVSSGVYFYKMKADNFLQTKKMILMK